MKKVSLVGGRGHTGKEILKILFRHPQIEIESVFSSSKGGEPIDIGRENINLTYKHYGDGIPKFENEDAILLALPNGESKKLMEEIDSKYPEITIIDLSSDFRFDETWQYRLPEISSPVHSKRISNPGCYATTMQLMMAPIEKNIEGYANFFGVSGYSGAGSKPNERNDKNVLKNNVLPYSLVKHLHEKEVNHYAYTKVFFSPHVGNFFRGILITANFTLKESLSLEEVKDNFTKFYKPHDLIKIQSKIPNIKEAAGTSLAIIGGFQFDSDNKRLSFCCVIDNLLKGAATQAIQNLNSAFGWNDNLGV
jgi:N-acetyl-gamma-glutamyl-phosphate reductase common form